jgi:hypothetical protein
MSSGIWRRVVRRKLTDVSEEHVTCILQVGRVSQVRNQREAESPRRQDPSLLHVLDVGLVCHLHVPIGEENGWSPMYGRVVHLTGSKYSR